MGRRGYLILFEPPTFVLHCKRERLLVFSTATTTCGSDRVTKVENTRRCRHRTPPTNSECHSQEIAFPEQPERVGGAPVRARVILSCVCVCVRRQAQCAARFNKEIHKEDSLAKRFRFW